MNDFSNFSVTETDANDSNSGEFEPLSPGLYRMRVVSYERQKSRSDNDQIVMRVKALHAIAAHGSCKKGTCNWFVTLSDKAAPFVRSAVVAAAGGPWAGNLLSDDDAKSLFLGKVVRAQVRSETVNGKQRARVGNVQAATKEDLDETPHEPADLYWNTKTFKSSRESSAPTGPAPASAPPASKNFDDDIPF